jgi:hypothetical protein
MLYSTCAPCGIGKEPIGAFRLTVSPEPAEADPVGDGDPAGEGDLAGEDAVWLVAGEADVAGPTLVIPAVQAVADRPAAQVTAMAMRRCMFIGWPFSQPGGCRFKTADLRLEEHLAVSVAVLSRICDSGRVFGTVRHRVPLLAAEPGGITRLLRITGLDGPPPSAPPSLRPSLPKGAWRAAIAAEGAGLERTFAN